MLRYSNRLAPSGPVPTDANVGGRIQIKLGFDTSSLRLIVTLICAAGLTIRSNGAARNPYAKVKISSCDRNCIKFLIKSCKFLGFFTS